MTKFQVGVRLVALLVAALAGLSFVLFDVLGVRLGAQPFPVTVFLPRGGGLYPDGFVTYRGVDVGRISTIDLSSKGAVVKLTIDPGVQIPANATAQVHELSVAGEQYLDLVPTSGSGPLLRAGSVIGQSHTNVPVSVFTLLDDAGQLIGSVNSNEVQTITDSLGTGFANTGQDLRTITVAAQNLVAALQASQPATVSLLNNGGALLSTALASQTDLNEISQAAQTITAQLRASDSDVNALLANAVPAEAALSQIVQDDAGTITQLINHLAGLSDVAIVRQPAVATLIQQLPIFVNKFANSVVNGAVQVQLTFNNANTVCPYVLGAQTAEPTAPTGSPALGNTCGVSAPDLLQRGAANAPVGPGG
ncbi:MAG TPA: MlaD family protein [Acidimicrobiales bacterium]|jgi:phospholipid/cholesterol/gamma-HCH transport system substrate-binding protein|nr:MlaD family protein [Acidimicrobiales bacterium]